VSNQRSLGRFEVKKPHSYESFPLAPWNELFAEITHITGRPEIPRTPEDEGPGPLRRGFNYLRNKFLAMKNTLAGRSARRRMK
jgi:hypothetical protein